MRVLRVFARPCGLHGAVVEDVDLQEDGVVVVHARPRAGERGRCGRCGRCSPGYDRGEGRRRWRALDPGTIRAYLGAEAPRVRCRTHGVTVARVPWCPSRCLAHARLRGSGGLAGHPGPQERHHPAPARLLARGGRGSSRGWWPTAGRGWPIPWMAFAGSASTRSRIAAASATSWASSATTAGDWSGRPTPATRACSASSSRSWARSAPGRSRLSPAIGPLGPLGAGAPLPRGDHLHGSVPPRSPGHRRAR